MTDLEQPEEWLYQPDETPKRKHSWDKDEAGFLRLRGRAPIGKCPQSMTLADAQALLNGGIPWNPRGWRFAYPKRIYAIHEGVLYRATPTVAGVSYHGFPEFPDNFPDDRDLRALVLARARQLGCEGAVKRSMRW